MINPRLLLALVAMAPFAAAGCGPTYTPAASASLTAEPGRYPPRVDLMAVKKLDGAPAKWSSQRFPPLLSVRLAPNTPDPELAADLRKQLGKNVLDPRAFEPEVWMPNQSDRLTRLLDAHFGTPAVPTVTLPDFNAVLAASVVRFDPAAGLGENLKAARAALGKAKVKDLEADWTAAADATAQLKLDDATLARGSVVYRRWCLQCHGPSGAGDAAYAVEGGPPPRDYRQGVFKFTSSLVPGSTPKKAGLSADGKARRADLARTVRHGLPGSMMPAFPTLSDAEVDDVVSYVIHLSVRGEVEFATLAKAVKPGEEDAIAEGGELDWLFVKHFVAVLNNWQLAERHAIPIPTQKPLTETERIDAALRGYRLYNDARVACAGCHANYGRAAGLYWDAWGTVVKPRNLTLGVYRGGRGGEQLYARVYAGIPVSGMLPFGANPALQSAPGEPDKIWDIVHFLNALGDPADRKRLQERDPDFKLDP